MSSKNRVSFSSNAHLHTRRTVGSRATLVPLFNQPETQYHLDASRTPKLTIGREGAPPDAYGMCNGDLLLDLQQQPRMLSAKHAEMVFDGGVWQIKDLKSKNGTMVNGTRVRTSMLYVGDVITFGGAANVELGETIGPASGISIYQYKIEDTIRPCLKKENVEGGAAEEEGWVTVKRNKTSGF